MRWFSRVVAVGVAASVAACVGGGSGGGGAAFIPISYDAGVGLDVEAAEVVGDASSSGGAVDGSTSGGLADAGADGLASDSATSGDAVDAGSSGGPADANCPTCCKTAADCDDGDACTADSCNVDGGKCTNAKIGGCGELSAPCAAKAPCQQGVCDPVTNACVACTTSKDCGAGKLCQAQQCKAAKACSSDVDCKAQNQVCAKSDGVCVDCVSDADCAENSACFDHACKPADPCKSSKDCAKVCDAKLLKCVDCVGSEDCAAGQYCAPWHACVPTICKADACAGNALFECRPSGGGYDVRPDCADDNPCTDDGCETGKGCTATPNAAPCDDGNSCTSNDGCSAGQCKGGSTPCDDANPCTDDKCQAQTGCYHTANTAACDDNNKCTTADACKGGACAGTKKTAKDCDDGNPCTDDSCAAGAGCEHKYNEHGCDDGNACTDTDKCLAGKCTGQSTKCDDGNKCTTDGCDVQGGCTHLNNSSPCDDGKYCSVDDACANGGCHAGKARDCSDAQTCTTDICSETAAKCTYSNASSATYCNDANACTNTDRCSLGKCVGKTINCSDANPCTDDSCDSKTGCKHTANTAACNDNDECTLADVCKASKCTAGAGKPTCNDNNACTTDGCDKAKGCAYDDASGKCNDLDPCTADTCDSKTGTCSSQPITGCCAAHDKCDDKDATTVDQCADNKCWFSKSGCVDAKACSDGDACTVDTCEAGKCAHKQDSSQCSTTAVTFDFEADLQGWTADAKTTGGIQWTQKAIGGTPKGKGAAAFAKPDSASFSSLQCANYGYLESPEIKLAAGQKWTLDIDFKIDVTTGYSSYNAVYFYAYNDAKTTLLGSASWTTSNKGWITRSYDVSALAGVPFKLKIRGRLGNYSCSSSSYKASGAGILLDHLAFSSDGKAAACTADADCDGKFGCLAGMCVGGACAWKHQCCTTASQCDDGRSCTSDTCSGGKCKFSAAADCCQQDADCTGGNACTLNRCVAGKCSYAKLAQCCLKDTDCDDKDDKCTTDSCDVKTGKCTFVKTCCAKDTDCDDGDAPCTSDKCDPATTKCVFTPTGAQGCCAPELWTHNFDDGSAKGITFKNSHGAAHGWQVWQQASYYKSPKGALYYGDPVAKNYKFTGSNSGTATLPTVQLPDKSGLTLRFWAFFQKETSSTYDKLSVRIQPEGGSTTTLWTTGTSDADGIWYDKSLSLSAYKGKKVTVSFYFATGDGSANSELGVLLDDVRLLQTCP